LGLHCEPVLKHLRKMPFAYYAYAHFCGSSSKICGPAETDVRCPSHAQPAKSADVRAPSPLKRSRKPKAWARIARDGQAKVKRPLIRHILMIIVWRGRNHRVQSLQQAQESHQAMQGRPVTLSLSLCDLWMCHVVCPAIHASLLSAYKHNCQRNFRANFVSVHIVLRSKLKIKMKLVVRATG
jgi:hypothetical protein